jgi:hypothetical protein
MFKFIALIAVAAGVFLIGAVQPATASTPDRVVYTLNDDGTWRVAEGDWRVIPRDGGAVVSVVKPAGGFKASSASFASYLGSYASAPVVQEQAGRWRGAARIIVTWTQARG